jgi:hypothetical protein
MTGHRKRDIIYVSILLLHMPALASGKENGSEKQTLKKRTRWYIGSHQSKGNKGRRTKTRTQRKSPKEGYIEKYRHNTLCT